ncbi:hypothetical protein AG1IA_02147 [Rhizoctonia solani AG-1 IA]|uniref:Uncharacterized protein n=1 Tax=Thanatephorus cucumeris (strain AG1-IA) TaxID=983506 RepID=L8X0V0_THACA|nr:hypothetical protein AG1IA_02147 [Rhizoctonia solani AG-1 IA]
MSRPLKRIPIPEPKRRRPPPKDSTPKRETSATPAPATSDGPQGAYVDYKLTSSRHSDKKWDVFKLQSHHDTPIDLHSWPAPVKLNRKDFKSRNQVEEAAGPLIPMLGEDGKPVIGADGKIVMLNADGTRVKKEDDPKGKKKAKEDPNAKKKAFMKKTRQVHMIPDEIRAFRKEHRKDWLLEDNGGGLAANQSWSGKYSDANDKQIYAFFAPVPGNDKEFRFIPVHRFYNFTRNNNVSTERVESQVGDITTDIHRPAYLPPIPKKEEEDEKPTRGGRRLRVVNNGRERYGGEGDYDEMEYEDEVQDDEEGPAELPQDEDEKEAVERQKREYLRNKVSERVEPESDEDEDDGKGYTEDGRQLKKLMKKMLNESDDEKNPYADSVGCLAVTFKMHTQGVRRMMKRMKRRINLSNHQLWELCLTHQHHRVHLHLALKAPSPINLHLSCPNQPRMLPMQTTLHSELLLRLWEDPLCSLNEQHLLILCKRKDHPDRAGTPTPPQKRPTPTPQSPSPATPGASSQKKKKSKHDLVAPNGDPLPEVITEEHAIEYLRKMGGAVQTGEVITYFKRALKHDPENQKRLTDALKKVSSQAQKGYIKLIPQYV